MSKVWVVTQADYDQNEVVGVFSSEELANAYVEIGGANEIKCVEVDEHADAARRGLRRYWCDMRRDSWTIHVREVNFDPHDSDDLVLAHARGYDDEGRPHATATVYARDKVEAERLAVARRVKWLSDEAEKVSV